MLKKNMAIKNVGRFCNSALCGNTTLTKHTFIYGANGFVKTTICSTLRSLKTGDDAHIILSQNVGTTDPQSVELLTSTGAIHFDGSPGIQLTPICPYSMAFL